MSDVLPSPGAHQAVPFPPAFPPGLAFFRCRCGVSPSPAAWRLCRDLASGSGQRPGHDSVGGSPGPDTIPFVKLRPPSTQTGSDRGAAEDATGRPDRCERPEGLNQCPHAGLGASLRRGVSAGGVPGWWVRLLPWCLSRPVEWRAVGRRTSTASPLLTLGKIWAGI
jgi:hypothetical protein